MVTILRILNCSLAIIFIYLCGIQDIFLFDISDFRISFIAASIDFIRIIKITVMEYTDFGSSDTKHLTRWQSITIPTAAIIAAISLEICYLLIKLTDLDPVHLALGICQVVYSFTTIFLIVIYIQASTLLIFHLIIILAVWKSLGTLLLGISIM